MSNTENKTAGDVKPVTTDNGYWQTWERECGHRLNISTEQMRMTPAAARQRHIAKQLSGRPCTVCSIAAVTA